VGVADIYLLEWDDENEQHLARHGIQASEVRQILSNRHVTMRNPRDEDEGRVLLIGETHGGRILTVSLAPTSDDATWRPVTGWLATDEEKTRFERAVR
jgi:uncharacterized DUF497 family protein